MFLVLLVYALFASVFTTGKTALEYAQPFFLVGSRMVFAGGLLLCYQFFFHREQFKVTKQDVKHIFLFALFSIYLTNVFEFWGLQYLTSFKTCFIYSLSPFISAVLSYFFLQEKMSVKKWFGLCIGFSGFLPILLTGDVAEQISGELGVFSFAELAVIIATSASAYGWILLKQAVSHRGIPFVMMNGLAMVMGGVMALFQSAWMETWHPLPVTEFYPFIMCALILVLVSNLLAYNLYGYLLKKYSATFMSFAGLSTPLFTAFFGWMFLGEEVTLSFYLSLAIVSLGLVLFYQEELKKDPLVDISVP